MNKLTTLFSIVLTSTSLLACIPSLHNAREANRQHVQRMCENPNYAYESGLNDGMKRRSLDTSWVDSECMMIEMRPQIRESYQAGYQQGLQNAPIVVEGRGFGGRRGGGGGYASSAQTCRFSSDCGDDGYSCRADAYGTNVCMGYGDAGDPCWFGSDCLSGSCNGGAKTCQ